MKHLCYPVVNYTFELQAPSLIANERYLMSAEPRCEATVFERQKLKPEVSLESKWPYKLCRRETYD